jgi:uncharacterized protein (DUF1684 family)
MRRFFTIVFFVGILIVVGGSMRAPAAAADSASAEAYAAEHEMWRADRIAFLKGPDGYLNLAGLHWIKDGMHTFGSSEANNLVFPSRTAEMIGKLQLSNGLVLMTVEEGVEVQVDGSPARSVTMLDDTSDAPVTAVHGSVAWTIIRRDDRIAVRVRDFDHTALNEFQPPHSYALNEDFRLRAEYRPYESPRVVHVETVIEGLEYKPQAPGKLHFNIGSQAFELEAYAAGEKLFLIFGDQTSGRDTYPAGRFLYTELPDANGMTVLDFNKAYNPPCAFNAFATCPVASPRNRLHTRITAGELYDPELHNVH